MKINKKTILLALFMLMGVIYTAFSQQTAKKALTEDQKIEALISGVEKTTNIQFYRNGSYYDAATAASHLRLKRKKAGSAIKTASEFIDKLASQSSMTDEEYRIRYANGKEVKARDYFYAQLKTIETSK